MTLHNLSQEVSDPITGKIEADPNPLPPEASCPVTLHWRTNAGTAEVSVSEDGAAEKLLALGSSGSFNVEWIQAGRHYLFRLYSTEKRRALLDEVTVWRRISGRLQCKPDPDPLSAEGRIMLQWEITAPAIAEVCILEKSGAEKVVCRGESSSYEVAGLRAGAEYVFRLYAGTEPRQLLDEVTASVSDIPWAKLLERLKRANKGNAYSNGLAEFIAGAIPGCLGQKEFPKWFQLWEENGFHVTPVHFYEPIPDSRALGKELWERKQDLLGVEMNEAMQVHLLRDVFPRFKEEYDLFPVESAESTDIFFVKNGSFEEVDPMVAYCLIRHFRPRQIIEVGSGYSTLLLAQAARKNGCTTLRSIDPYAPPFLTGEIAGLTSLLPSKVEDVDLSYFDCLDEGDCLFIDTSHVVRIGGDVNRIFLELLPRLNPGVMVHIHDIFLPFDYPRDWVVSRRRFWTEQYLLQAFLSYNSDFEVLVCNSYLNTYYPEELRTVFPTTSPKRGGSLWMRRKSTSGRGNAANRQDP
ncbi:MAG: class I SAM-dependent methyltransferase [Chthoniobacterales bacterium]